MSLKPKQKGYIYLIRTSTFRNLNKYIYKLGKSIEYTIRFNNYDKFSEIYVLYYVEDIDFIEDILIQIFKRKFTHEDMYGKEYFSGAINDMLQTIEYIINGYGFIEKKDLFDIWIQDKLKRFIIYNDEHINTFMYEIINDIMNENDIENIDINDVTNYNQFYNTYVINNKNLYNEKIIKKDENKIKLKTYAQNYNEINKVEELNNIIKNDLSETKLNESDLNQTELNESDLIKSDLTESKLNKDYLKNKLIYICHYCVKYVTQNRKDMVKHCNRKNICTKYNEIFYEDSKILTLSKRFYFHFNMVNITINDLLFIVKNYTNEENYIYINYNEINKVNDNKKLMLIMNENINVIDKLNNNEKNNDEENNINESKNNQNHLYKEFRKIYYNKDKNRYVCDRCLAEYKSKQSLENHLLNIKKCNANIQIKNTINKSKQNIK